MYAPPPVPFLLPFAPLRPPLPHLTHAQVPRSALHVHQRPEDTRYVLGLRNPLADIIRLPPPYFSLPSARPSPSATDPTSSHISALAQLTSRDLLPGKAAPPCSVLRVEAVTNPRIQARYEVEVQDVWNVVQGRSSPVENIKAVPVQ